jgi:hypothetical protein
MMTRRNPEWLSSRETDMLIFGRWNVGEPLKSVGQELLNQIKRLLNRKPEPPEDPYAYVGAPKKPRLPRRSASAAAELDQ